MPVNKRIATAVLNAATFIILEVAALSMLRYNGVLQDTWISKGMHAFYGTIWGGTEQVKHYFSLKKANDRLAEENFLLSEQLRLYREASAGADTLLQGMKSERFSYMPATIAKISNNRQHNYLIIDKGSDNGVLPQSGVITSRGVIGIIDAVSRNYSYAISLKNSEMTVSARIGRTGPVGTMKWDGMSNSKALLNEIPHHISFEKGDTVFTSGLSSIFPPDIPLGTIEDSRLVNGATHQIRVILFEDFRSLRYVTIAHNNGREEIDELISSQQ